MWILGWVILVIVFIFISILRVTLKETKIIIIISNWFKQHLNWTWVMFYLLTIILAFSVVVPTVLQPPPHIPHSYEAWTRYTVTCIFYR